MREEGAPLAPEEHGSHLDDPRDGGGDTRRAQGRTEAPVVVRVALPESERRDEACAGLYRQFDESESSAEVYGLHAMAHLEALGDAAWDEEHRATSVEESTHAALGYGVHAEPRPELTHEGDHEDGLGGERARVSDALGGGRGVEEVLAEGDDGEGQHRVWFQAEDVWTTSRGGGEIAGLVLPFHRAREVSHRGVGDSARDSYAPTGIRGAVRGQRRRHVGGQHGHGEGMRKFVDGQCEHRDGDVQVTEPHAHHQVAP